MTHNSESTTGRDLAILIGGIAAGILGSRLLPPLVAAASGAGRAHMGGDAFDLLIEDHRQILSTLDRMVDAPSDATVERSKLFLMLKRKLAKHALAEEDVVYPLLHERSEQADQSKHLYDEHADMKILLFDLEERLMSGADWRDQAVRLRDIIREHAREEEEQVFPRVRESIGQTKLPTVSGQIRREEALIL